MKNNEKSWKIIVTLETNLINTNIGSNLASKIQNTTKTFEILKLSDTNSNDSNVMIKISNKIIYRLFMIFHSSVSEGIFPELLKVVKVSPMFKVGVIEEVGNYKQISVLPISSKVLERIMCDRTYQCFKENDMLFPKHFDFQVNNSMHHWNSNLDNYILTLFKKAKLTLGALIDLSKEFDTVNNNHSIL